MPTSTHAAASHTVSPPATSALARDAFSGWPRRRALAGAGRRPPVRRRGRAWVAGPIGRRGGDRDERARTMRRAVFRDRAPLVRAARCRAAASTPSMGSAARRGPRTLRSRCGRAGSGGLSRGILLRGLRPAGSGRLGCSALARSGASRTSRRRVFVPGRTDGGPCSGRRRPLRPGALARGAGEGLFRGPMAPQPTATSGAAAGPRAIGSTRSSRPACSRPACSRSRQRRSRTDPLRAWMAK